MFDFQIFVSQISDVVVIASVGTLVLLILFFWGYKKDVYKIACSSVFAIGTTYSLKYILQVPRPETMLILEDGYRFPSGHATVAALLMALGLYYTCHNIKNIYVRYVFYSVCVAWFILVSYSRLYLGVHIFVDVLAGGIIGVVATVVTVGFFKNSK